MKKISQILWFLFLGSLSLSQVFSEEIKEVKRAVALSPNGQVAIHTFKGSVNITTWDSPAVDIYARIESDGTGPEERAKVRDTEVQIDTSANAVQIKSDYRKVEKRNFSLWGLFNYNSGAMPFVHYTIKMPRTAKLDIRDHKSKIHVADLRSEVRIDTHKGIVNIAQLDGALKLHTHKGEVRVQFANLAGASRIETHKGDIEIMVPKGQGFELDTDLGRRGSLDSNLGLTTTLVKLRGGRKEYRGAVHGGGPRLSLRTFKGAFRLREV